MSADLSRETGGDDISGAMARAAHGSHGTLRQGQRVGPYILETVGGQGSFGAVWRARQERPFKRTVAVKILHESGNSERVVARFKREQRVLATLDHPNIVSILDAGVTESGNPWYSMEWVDGQPMEEMDDWRVAARAFASIADTLQFAHDNKVIHRDIKPQNLMRDHTGRARIIDFGLSAIQTKLDESDHVRTLSSAVGTPAHMAPEQVDGRSTDSRTDIFGLGGALLFVLTGRPPHDVVDMPIHAALKVVADHEVQFERGEADAPDDLRAVVLKATAWNPEERYDTMTALADDLRRVLAGIPPLAAHAGPVRRLWRKCQRRPALAAMTALAGTAVIGGVLVALLLLVGQQAARRKAASAGTRAIIAAVDSAAKAGDLSSAALGLEAVATEQRFWEWNLLQAQTNQLQRVVATADGDVLSLAVDTRGNRIAAAATNSIAIVDLSTDSVTWLNTATKRPVWWSLAWLPDGRLAVGDNHGELAVFDLETGELNREFFDSSVLGVVPLSDDTMAIAAGTDILLVQSDTLNASARRTVTDGHLYTLRLISDRLFAADSNGDVLTIDSSLTGDVRRSHVHDSRIHRLVPHPDGARVVATSHDHTSSIIDTRTLTTDVRLIGHRAAVWDAHWMDDGTLLTASTDYTIKQWDPVRGVVLRSYSSPQQHVWSLAQSPDGRVWSGGHDRTIRAWSLDGATAHNHLHDGPVICTTWSPDGSRLATLGPNHLAIRGGPTIATEDTIAIAWIDSSTIALGHSDGRVVAVDAESGEATWTC